MINIADNRIVQEQVKRTSSDPAARKDSGAQRELPPVVPAYPVTGMVLEDGRYYALKTEK